MIADHFIPRNQLSEAELEEALKACASEPIHIPGSIQPHGVLIGLTKNNTIVYSSANAQTVFQQATQDILGTSADLFFSEDSLSRLRLMARGKALEMQDAYTIELLGQAFDAYAFISGDYLIIELEPTPAGTATLQDTYDKLHAFAAYAMRAEDMNELFNYAVEAVRAITGFDRVKLYRFDPDWHGEVVAESRVAFMPSYKGLHFPSSDIPEQARRLYSINHLRLIADVSYAPVPLLAASQTEAAPLDLSYSTLRSVSPIHVQYLENINVRASMSVSIMCNGKLWGLIACHHASPLIVPTPARRISEIIGHMLAAQIAALEEKEKGILQERRETLVQTLAAALEQHTRFDQMAEETQVFMRACLRADGLIIVASGHRLTYGVTPDDEVVRTFLRWLTHNAVRSVFYTDDAQNHFRKTEGLEKLNGGLLAAPISARDGDYIIWTRTAQIEEVNWAGNPEKPVEKVAGGYRLTPRSSFDLWKQEIRKRSLPWTYDDVSTARRIASIMLEGEKISAQESNNAKSEFLATISHEMRTPLGAVLGLTQALQTSGPLTGDQQKYITTLQESAEGLVSLINDLLDISKAEARQIELESIPFQPGKIVQGIVNMLMPKAKEKGIVLRASEKGINGVTLLGDPTRVRQIILNLVSNAVKFTENGIVDICVTTHASKANTAQLAISVRDSGIGIAPDRLETVFQKFSQADSSISRRFGGTGLGLAICKMFVDAMGGRIEVTSTLGEGSLFTVSLELPLVQADQQKTETVTAAMAAAEKASDQPLKRILLVEDYEANILVAGIYLKHFGHDYDVARNGVEAVEKAKAGRYAIILMDVEMPGLNGFEATRAIRQLEEKSGQRRTRIIGMTAHALKGDRDKCIENGMDDYLAKPISQQELQAKLA